MPGRIASRPARTVVSVLALVAAGAPLVGCDGAGSAPRPVGARSRAATEQQLDQVLDGAKEGVDDGRYVSRVGRFSVFNTCASGLRVAEEAEPYRYSVATAVEVPADQLSARIGGLRDALVARGLRVEGYREVAPTPGGSVSDPWFTARREDGAALERYTLEVSARVDDGVTSVFLTVSSACLAPGGGPSGGSSGGPSGGPSSGGGARS
ncbi:hypothetical protein HUT16_29830 [Kitasatospora sp. NA04385]|uniref:hypothetical protein n=1 Tax=Kitasatospora sp. NA04385 TaxID=2742135 RepID=UPI00159255DB|nr:hypothetical protein [Kitasatospora sp. NA04385]QKW22732.1 hypothetical protein HUT16_29830 [Kitasatospora sp. NA04385]